MLWDFVIVFVQVIFSQQQQQQQGGNLRNHAATAIRPASGLLPGVGRGGEATKALLIGVLVHVVF